MPSDSQPTNRHATTRAGAVLLLVTLVVLIAQHVSVSATVIEGHMPEIAFVTVSAPLEVSPDAIPALKKPEPRGPGGAQPWVRWSYIP